MSSQRSKKLNPIIVKRLMPLGIAIFLQSFVLWYSIEKLFMTTIGFNNTLIAVMACLYAVTMLFLETPSGLLADRWSRKGVLAIAGLFLAVASLIGGLSGDVLTYMFSAIAWGGYFALHSGTYDSIVYDTLLEETGKVDDYEKYYGRIRALDGIGLVVASVLGGVVAQFLGMRETYFITVPVVLISLFFLWKFREPLLHKAHEHVSLRAQVRSTFGSLLKRGVVLWLSLAMVLSGVVIQMIFEFDQLWLIALQTPIFAYGPINAFLLLTISLGGLIAAYLSRQRIVTIAFAVLTTGLSFTFALIHSAPIIVVSMFLIVLVLMAYSIVFNKLLHDQLSSNVRAGAMSAISTFSKALFIPIALVFGVLSQSLSVFIAAWIVIGVVAVYALSSIIALSHIRRSREPIIGQLKPVDPVK